MPKRPVVEPGTSVWQRAASPTRRRSPACTLDQITASAIAIADVEGLEALTMRRLAAELDIAPTSLYWYFSTKSELHELMADAIIGRIEVPESPSGDWRADLSAIAWSSLREARHHPWFTQVSFQDVPGPCTMHYGERALATFSGEDIDPISALNGLAALNNYVFGFAQRAAQLAPGTSAPKPLHPGDGRPLAAERRARADLTGDDSFAFGLNCLLDGMDRRIATRHVSKSRAGQR